MGKQKGERSRKVSEDQVKGLRVELRTEDWKEQDGGIKD